MDGKGTARTGAGRLRRMGLRLHFRHMSHTITVRLPRDLATWLEHAAAQSGLPQGKIVRDQLEQARAASARQSFMRLAGSVRGPKRLSSLK